MDITDYATLNSMIARWLKRSNLTVDIPTFISLFETGLRRRLREQGSERVVLLTPDVSGFVDLPTDYLEWRSVQSGKSGKLKYLTPDGAQEAYGNISGAAQSFTIIGKTLLTYPLSPDQITLIYQSGFKSLSVEYPINWVLQKHPDLYLYGSLLQAEAFIQNDDRIPLWKASIEEILREIETQDLAARWGKSAMRINQAP